MLQLPVVITTGSGSMLCREGNGGGGTTLTWHLFPNIVPRAYQVGCTQGLNLCTWGTHQQLAGDLAIYIQKPKSADTSEKSYTGTPDG